MPSEDLSCSGDWTESLMHSRQAPYPELYLQSCDPDWSLAFLPGLGAIAGLRFLEQSCPVWGHYLPPLIGIPTFPALKVTTFHT